MKQDRKTEIKVGISLLVSVVILLWVIVWAKNVDLFSDKKELTISFNSVAGLTPGDLVAVNGVKKGIVESITLDGDTVLVKTTLDEDVDIRADASFSIMMLDLMGGKKIEISPGSSHQQIDYSVVQHGLFSGDISTAMATLSGMEHSIKNIIEELSITLSAVNDILVDDKFASDVKNAFSELNSLSKRTSQLIDENRAGIKSLIDSSKILVTTTNEFLQNNSNALTRTIEQTSTLVENSNRFIVKMDSLMKEIQSRENNIGKLLYDEQFYDDLKTSLENLKELTKILIEQLKNEGVNVDAKINLF